jgi:hypothetical protein
MYPRVDGRFIGNAGFPSLAGQPSATRSTLPRARLDLCLARGTLHEAGLPKKLETKFFV